MSPTHQQPHDEMKAIVARLSPILNRDGFHFEPDQNASSSGGPFESGFFKRLPFQIGLIVRGRTLGMPSYNHGANSAGHDELIEQLGRRKDALLRFDSDLEKYELYTTDGRTVIDALVSDLENIILPVLRTAPEKLKSAIVDAHKERIDHLMGR